MKMPEGVQKTATVEGITEYRLPNGLKVLLFPDQTKQTITVNITYLVGSRHESYGETGMAHLLEHLVFKGTPRHPNIPAELTSHGARPNGTTWVDRTNYFETFAANDENLNWALDLEADRMVNSYIAKKDLESEFSVVRNEMESGENNAFRVLWQRVMGTAYEWHNYGKSTIGARSDVENVPIDRLQAFYKRYYQPDNSVLLVAGKFDEAKTLDLIKKYFGAIPKPDRVLPGIYTVEPSQDGERMVTVRRTGDTQMLMAGYHVPPGSHQDAAAVAVMAEVLSSEPSGRLYKALVEPKKASAIFSLNLQTKEPGYLLFGSELRKENSLDDVRSTMTETVESFMKTAPTKEEVDRAKTAMLKDIELALNDPNRVGLEMSEWIAQGDWRLYFLTRDRLKKVTPEDVQRVAQTYLKQTNRTVGM
ncbi:MAG: insulinase family protein, partial [Acidobacteriota bacterium]|nr:insulinase family protein [Acidobacteriota bacterium]